MKNLILIISFCILACNSKPKNQKSESHKENHILEKRIVLNDFKDTSFVVLRHSNFDFIIRYYKNKPQYIQIQKSYVPKWENHFINEHRGVYFSINSETDSIWAMGYKYLKKFEQVELIIGKNGRVEKLEDWEDSNTKGKVIDVTKFKDESVEDIEKREKQ